MNNNNRAHSNALLLSGHDYLIAVISYNRKKWSEKWPDKCPVTDAIVRPGIMLTD